MFRAEGSIKKTKTYKLKKTAYIAKASKNPWYTFTWSINPWNEIHPWTNPVKWPHNSKFQTILSALSCQKKNLSLIKQAFHLL
jgi:hypothetical protein